MYLKHDEDMVVKGQIERIAGMGGVSKRKAREYLFGVIDLPQFTETVVSIIKEFEGED